MPTLKWCIWPFLGYLSSYKCLCKKILAHSRLWYFKTTKSLQKWLQTWFILLHLVLVWNVRVKSIWTHSAGGGANPTLPPPPPGSIGSVLFRVGTVSPAVPLEWSHQSKIFPPSCPLSSVLLSEILVAGHIVLHLSLGGSFVYRLQFALDFLNFF